jgi:hypothetical protein
MGDPPFLQPRGVDQNSFKRQRSKCIAQKLRPAVTGDKIILFRLTSSLLQISTAIGTSPAPGRHAFMRSMVTSTSSNGTHRFGEPSEASSLPSRVLSGAPHREISVRPPSRHSRCVSADRGLPNRLQHVSGRLVTYARSELVADRDWYRSVSFNEYRKLGGCDHQLTSIYQVSEQGAISTMCVHRAVGDRDFSAREVRLMRFFHDELGRLMRGPLVSGLEPGPDILSPRLRPFSTASSGSAVVVSCWLTYSSGWGKEAGGLSPRAFEINLCEA